MKALIYFLILYQLSSIESNQELMQKLCSADHSNETYYKLGECAKKDPMTGIEVFKAKCGFGKAMDETDFVKNNKLNCDSRKCFAKYAINPENNFGVLSQMTPEEKAEKKQEKEDCMLDVLNMK